MDKPESDHCWSDGTMREVREFIRHAESMLILFRDDDKIRTCLYALLAEITQCLPMGLREK